MLHRLVIVPFLALCACSSPPPTEFRFPDPAQGDELRDGVWYGVRSLDGDWDVDVVVPRVQDTSCKWERTHRTGALIPATQTVVPGTGRLEIRAACDEPLKPFSLFVP